MNRGRGSGHSHPIGWAWGLAGFPHLHVLGSSRKTSQFRVEALVSQEKEPSWAPSCLKAPRAPRAPTAVSGLLSPTVPFVPAVPLEGSRMPPALSVLHRCKALCLLHTDRALGQGTSETPERRVCAAPPFPASHPLPRLSRLLQGLWRPCPCFFRPRGLCSAKWITGEPGTEGPGPHSSAPSELPGLQPVISPQGSPVVPAGTRATWGAQERALERGSHHSDGALCTPAGQGGCATQGHLGEVAASPPARALACREPPAVGSRVSSAPTNSVHQPR